MAEEIRTAFDDDILAVRPELKNPKYAEENLQGLKSKYSARNLILTELRNLRFMMHDVKVPEAYDQSDPADKESESKRIKSYFAGKSVETEAGAFSSIWPTFRVPLPPDPTDDDIRMASDKEQFIRHYLWTLNRQPGAKDWFRKLVDFVVADGFGVLAGAYMPRAWQGLPQLDKFFKAKQLPENATDPEILGMLTSEEQAEFNSASDDFIKRNPLPFRARAVDPTTYFPVEGDFGTDAVFEDSIVELATVRRMAGLFGGMPREPGLEATQNGMRVVRMYDKEIMALYLDMGEGLEPVGSMFHKMHRIPYFEVPGQVTGSSDPRFEYIGTMFKLQHTIPHVDLLANVLFNRSYITGYPQLQAARSSGDNPDGKPEKIQFVPGEVETYDPNMGEGPIEPVKIQAASGDVEQTIAMLIGLSAESQIDPAVAGGGRYSGDSGFAGAQMAELSKTGYHQIPEHLSWGLSGFGSWILEMIDKEIGRKVWVVGDGERNGKRIRKWIGIGPDEINGYYGIEALIRPYNPIMDIARNTHYANMRDREMMPHRLALERSGEEQPDEVIEEIESDKLMKDPRVENAMVARALAEMGLAAPEDLGLNDQGQVVDPQMLAGFLGSLGGRAPGTPAVPGVGMTLNANNNAPNAVAIEPPAV